eukprot:NODE_5221_length_1047_cov_33.045455_g4661_i0.p1 GENE.NODE_5221_length_1047_cov_33.045455_g4661_i0~~NODE_5221_length_1047_cov_33.045455_g4661_i0.p1  ORF type:complete len:314 (-),score=63.17 NODE_5221_length_1047_cov_33.045455_g4661_i0:106-915(-)
MELLKACDIKFCRNPRLDVTSCTNLPIDLVFLPAADIAAYVAEGNVDMGITGQDIIEETGLVVEQLLNLNIGRCKVCVQVPKTDGITNPSLLLGKRIVTSFPNITKRYFDKLAGSDNHGTSIRVVHGSVEAACSLGLGDAVVDLVETGETMRAAGLEVCSEIMTSESVLIANPHSNLKELITYIKKRVQGYVRATMYCYVAYNAPRDRLSEVLSITPGHTSPTVSTLEDSSWVAVSALVKRPDVHIIMDRLEAAGAVDVLVFNLSNTRL